MDTLRSSHTPSESQRMPHRATALCFSARATKAADGVGKLGLGTVRKAAEGSDTQRTGAYSCCCWKHWPRKLTSLFAPPELLALTPWLPDSPRPLHGVAASQGRRLEGQAPPPPPGQGPTGQEYQLVLANHAQACTAERLSSSPLSATHSGTTLAVARGNWSP